RHMKIPFPVGTTEEGKLIIEDLFSTGNIFIAGVKGSGKTNFINTLITTMIQVKTPQELRLLIVNRTEEETNIYKGIPHLGMPPISDPAMTGQIMNYLRDEMERRYVYFARKNVKDITKYNDVMNRNDEGEKALPYIVLIIEEALNMVKCCDKPDETMNDIAALSLKAKKAGIFFVVATSNVSNRMISKPEMLSVFPNRIIFDLGTEGVYKDYFGDEFDYRQDWSMGHLYFFSHLGTTPRKLKAIRTPEAEASKTFAETEENYSTQTLKTYISGNKEVDRNFRKKYLWLISENSRLSKDNRAMMFEMAKKDKEIAELREKLGL
nr:hypothetical protein [Sphaerochaetaceae bacterium]